LESGLLREGADRYELSRPLPPLAIPSTLHASLLGRRASGFVPSLSESLAISASRGSLRALLYDRCPCALHALDLPGGMQGPHAGDGPRARASSRGNAGSQTSAPPAVGDKQTQAVDLARINAAKRSACDRPSRWACARRRVRRPATRLWSARTARRS